jgi:glycosyltransferase involved in cell wall biosynthesis
LYAIGRGAHCFARPLRENAGVSVSPPGAPLVSTVIPTFNRKDDAVIAIRTALAQTYPHQEILVVDDGSTDGTEAFLRKEFGERIQVLRKPNGGVSSARNHGMAAARGELIALLDSDDEWLPEKLAAQVAFLTAHADFGMVITDVMRMDQERVDFELFRRREFIPEDGHVLRWVLRNPALAPASAMLRRAVYQDVGGFDTTLRTAEDLDFHLRVALRWKIGVIERPLTRAMRGHDGLSALARTYHDYMIVVERFLRDHHDEVPEPDRKAALLMAYTRNARGLLWDGEYRDALRLSVRSISMVQRREDTRELARLGYDFARRLGALVRQRIRGS